MDTRQKNLSSSYWYYPVIISLMVLVLIIVSGTAVLADKQKSTVTIVTTPSEPGNDVAFTITGVLTDGSGKALGNKKVTLESISPDNGNGEYTYLAVTSTDINGSYSFLRPAGSPAENLRVKFAGNDNYEGAVSSVVPGHKQVATQNGDVIPTVVKGDSKILIKVSPTNPSLGQSVSITGQLISANGTPIAGKKVILESSDRSGVMADFSTLGSDVTDKNGFYNFSVGGASTTSFIRVRFAGDNEYGESISDQIMVL
jgi:hypothetical protein